MATITKRVRVANPRKGAFRKRRKNARKIATPRNSKGRFVKLKTKRRAKAKRRASNPSLSTRLRHRTVRRVTRKRAPRRKRNPLLMELGVLNPTRRKNVAKKYTRKRRTKRNPAHRRHVSAVKKVTRRRRRRTVAVHHRRRRRRSNPVTVVRYRRRTSNRRRSRRSNRSSRRNPALFGRSGGKDLLMMTGGVLVGVAATKFLPSLLPTSIVAMGGGSPIMGVVITGAGAFLAGWAARKFVGETFGDAVLLGGLAQAASQLMNAFLPSSLAGPLALSGGMGDIVPGWYSVPQNPVTSRAPIPIAPPASGGMGAFRTAWGRR